MIKALVRNALQKRGYVHLRSKDRYHDLGDDFVSAYNEVKADTYTSVERMQPLWESVRHVVRRGIPGAIVECGVWRGGSAVLCARALQGEGVTDRDLYLYDTYEGMVEPTDKDVNHKGETAHSKWERDQADDHNEWCYAALDVVRANMARTGYPAERIHYVEGKVEDTIPGVAPEQVALLRLDTDLYESTLHELQHLWPRLSPGGILIIDDYGHWEGSREATDEYFADRDDAPLLVRVDYAGRVAIKA